MRFDLAAMTRRQRNIRRPKIVLRDIVPPATMATDLFRGSYLPIIQAWERAIEPIMAEYERTLASMTTDAPADVDARVGSVADEITRLLLVLTPRLRDWALRVEKWHRGKWRGAVLSATGIDLQTMLGPETVRDTVENIIQWNVSLVKDVSDQARQKISSSIFSGLNQRKPAREVAKEIRETVAMSRARATRIASDQLTKLSSALASERRREAGIDTWVWRSSHKLHFRPEHQARDGKQYTDETAPEDLPGMLPYCGCREQAVLTFD